MRWHSRCAASNELPEDAATHLHRPHLLCAFGLTLTLVVTGCAGGSSLATSSSGAALTPCELLTSNLAVTLDVAQAGVDRGPAENTAEACLYTGDTATPGVISDAALALGKVPGDDSDEAFLEVEIAASATHSTGLTYTPLSGIGDFALTATGPDAGRYVSAVAFVKDDIGIDVFTVNPTQVALSVVENVAKEIAAKV
jgi:hypothetical protein